MNEKDELKKLGNKFRLARIDKGMNQTELANKIGKDQPSINRFEKGNINPSYKYMLEICEGLEISLVEILKKY